MAKKDDKTKEVSVEDFNEIIMGVLNKDEKVAYSLNDAPVKVDKFIATGSTILDYKISNRRGGGIPVGRITEINGVEGTGKSLLVSHIIANAQKEGAVVALAETEMASAPDFMKRLGVNLNKMTFWQPRTLESFFTGAEKIIIKSREQFPNKERPVLLVLDSIAATPTEVEIEGTYDANGRPGLMAKAMSLGLKKITQTVGHEHVTLIFINQLRMKMNAMPFADPYVAPGGMALPFHASVRLRMSSTGKIKHPISGDVIGTGTKIKIYKNRIGPPHREAEFNIMYDRGINDVQSIYDFLQDYDVIKKKPGSGGSVFNGEKHGVALVKEFSTDEWKHVFADYNDQVFSVLDKLLITTFEGTSNVEVNEKNLDKEELS